MSRLAVKTQTVHTKTSLLGDPDRDPESDYGENKSDPEVESDDSEVDSDDSDEDARDLSDLNYDGRTTPTRTSAPQFETPKARSDTAGRLSNAAKSALGILMKNAPVCLFTNSRSWQISHMIQRRSTAQKVRPSKSSSRIDLTSHPAADSIRVLSGLRISTVSC